MRTKYLFFLLFLAAVRPAPARAQEKLPDCSTSPACRSLFGQAREQSGKGNLREALRLYQRAYEVCADPALLFSIARVLHKQGQTADAAPYYRRFLESPLDDAEPKRKAQEYLDQLAQVGPPPLSASAQSPPESAPAQPTEAPALVLSSRPAEARPAARPLYKKWWFWTALGGVALATVTTGAILAGREGASVPNGTTAAFHIHF